MVCYHLILTDQQQQKKHTQTIPTICRDMGKIVLFSFITGENVFHERLSAKRSVNKY